MPLPTRRSGVSFLLLAVLASACAGGARRSAAPESSAFGGLVRFRPAPGWTLDAPSPLDGDAVVLSSGTAARIRLALREGDPEKDESVRALEQAPWDAPMGGPARSVGTIRAAGADVALMRRVSGGLREETGESPAYFTDEFCAVPLNGGFLLLAFETEDRGAPPSPDALDARLSGWRALLASLRVASRPAGP